MSTLESDHIRETDGLVLEMSRRLEAPPERVFAAFSTLEGITAWWGPGPCHLTGGSVDFTVGGHYDVRMQTEEMGEIGLSGVYREIVPFSRIAFSWQWSGHEDLSDALMEVRFEFEELPDSATEMRLTQTGFPSRESADNHCEGWAGSFEKLGPSLS